MVSRKTNNIDVSVQIESVSSESVRLKLTGRVDRHSVGMVWKKIEHSLNNSKLSDICVDCCDVDQLDSLGAGFLGWLYREQQALGRKFVIEGLKKDFSEMVEFYRSIEFDIEAEESHSVRSFFEKIGSAAVEIVFDIREQVIFAGEISAAAAGVFLKPKKIRWKDVFLTAESAGADAFGIIALVGFLLGLILAYQSMHSLKDFGAEIYVADIVALSLFRELGPLMTAIILAGRSGSAFAAEIGTMKVHEEIDALTTMGLEPVRFLALPRILAVIVVTPLLGIVACFFGLIGSALVMLSRGFPISTYYAQITNAVDLVDFSSGVCKAFVFGILIASIGCLRGLQTKQGARAVGVSATRAVVSGIVLIVIADGIFAVIYNIMGI